MHSRRAAPAWPIRFVSGGLQLQYDGEVIEQAIEAVIGTQIGERRVRRDFGSRVPSLVFETDDGLLSTLADVYTREAIERWVPGVRVLSVGARRLGGEVEISVEYMDNSRGLRGSVAVRLQAPEGVPNG